MASLGQELRRERERRAVSLKDMADQTKIGLRYLEALEKERYDDLPGPFFIKGIFRAYAKFLGLPEDHFYSLYLVKTSPATGGEAKPEKPVREVSAEKRRLRPAARALGLAGLIFLGAAAAVYVYILKPQRGPLPVISEPRRAASERPAIAPPEVPPVVESGTIPESEDLTLALRFTAETWIHVAADGAVQLDGNRKAGERAACKAKTEFLLQTGNAGGFTATLNGRALKPLGAAGVVLIDVRISRDTLRSMEAEPDKPPAGKAGR